jgi:hypothetical protein
MRKDEEIRADMAQALDRPDREARDRSALVFLEVLLDIRRLLDGIDSWTAHIEGHTEKLKKLVTDSVEKSEGG